MTSQSTIYPDSKTPGRSTPADGRSAAETLEAAASELKAQGESMLETGRSRASELLKNGRARAAEWKGGFQEGIREKPIQSVLIAAAVGTVVGLLIGRRSS